MAAEKPVLRRQDAVGRAQAFSPFLREAMTRRPDVLASFLESGAAQAAEIAMGRGAETVESELRRRRVGVALAAALGDLSGELELEEVTAILSGFADLAIDRALKAAIAERMPGIEPHGFAVIALGKLGSCELNFSSDVDLLLLFDPNTLPRRSREDAGESAVRIGRRFVELLQKRTEDGYVARVDLRLRPSPEVTPIALPVNAAISYYESSAVGWERAAFIRARACAGDKALGEHFLSAIQPFVWRRALDFGAIEEIRKMGQAIRDHYAHRQQFGPGYDVKRGRGGIREVEFFVQARQLVHGGRELGLRTGSTLHAIDTLERSDHLDRGLARELEQAYRRLRTVEHRLQMVADQQTHLVPTDPEALSGVAKLHGFASSAELLDYLRPSIERVGEAFDELADSDDSGLPSDPDLLRSELGALGFTDVETVMLRIGEWRSGRPRSLRSRAARTAFEAMLPALLKAIASSADPNHALNRLSDIVERVSSGVNLYRLLQARPSLSALLARILTHAPVLSNQLSLRPELLDSLLDSSCFDPPPSAEEFAAFLEGHMRGQPYDIALDRVRRIVNERRFALGVQLIDLRDDPIAIGEGYARVAEGALLALGQAVVGEFEKVHGKFPGAELVILGLGRLGGGVLTHASDLDLVYLFTPPTADVSTGRKPLGPANYFNRLANRITAALSVPTAAGPLYEVDTRLRPEGSKGMLVVSTNAFARYQREEAWTWEHMALLRARPVFGPDQARQQVAQLVSGILHQAGDPKKVAADAVKMRAEMERHKRPAGPLDVKLGAGGLVDLEFAVHVLQLTRQKALDPHLETAVEQLAAERLIDRKIVEAQHLLTRMLVTLRLIAPDLEPTGESRELMAQACGAADWDELLARHAAARQSISKLWDRIKGAAV
jgi:glutamate-ammonia-ligase adenylyltransferase